MNRVGFYILMMSCIYSCSSSHVKYSTEIKSRLEPIPLFKDFDQDENYKLTFLINYPDQAGQTKDDAANSRKKILRSQVQNIIYFIYLLPQNIKTNYTKGGINNCDNESQILGVKCKTHEGKRFVEGGYIDPRDYIDDFKKKNNSTPPYQVYFHDKDLGKKETGYINSNKITYPSYSFPNFSLEKSYNQQVTLKLLADEVNSDKFIARTQYALDSRNFTPPMYEARILDYVSEKSFLTRISMFEQYVAVQESQEGNAPVINANFKLTQFIENHTFPIMDSDHFSEYFLASFVKTIDSFNLGERDDAYLRSIMQKGYLFPEKIFHGDQEEQKQISKEGFNLMLKDLELREKMFGLAFVSYSNFTPERIDKNSLKIDVEINLKKMFTDIKFEKIEDHLEK